jgi:hypothetical protein
VLAPITVFRDGVDLWVADGFHRTTGATQAGLTDIDAEVHPGDKRDAILYSCANKHGKARTNEDKRRAVGRLLTDAEWSRWSNVEVARHCGGSEFWCAHFDRIEVTRPSAPTAPSATPRR